MSLRNLVLGLEPALGVDGGLQPDPAAVIAWR